MQRRQRPDSAKMAEDLFSKLDSTGKGYIEESDLTSALSSLSSKDGTASASEIFSQLDSDSDGKVTKDELSSSLQKLSESLDNQFNQMRMQGAMPPPPPNEAQSSDEGLTKAELTSQLSQMGTTDTTGSSLMSKIVENFDAADTNEDGKVSLQEAVAYDKSTQSTATSASSDATASATTSTSTEKSDAQVFRQLMDLLRTYGTEDGSKKSVAASLLSISA
jgi:Ca2+-binding EF-hand superfamily protein